MACHIEFARCRSHRSNLLSATRVLFALVLLVGSGTSALGLPNAEEGELSAFDRTREMQVELIGRCADRYEAIQREYGMWQRCLLETVMILADWRQSARERLGLVECEQSGDAENPVVARNA